MEVPSDPGVTQALLTFSPHLSGTDRVCRRVGGEGLRLRAPQRPGHPLQGAAGLGQVSVRARGLGSSTPPAGTRLRHEEALDGLQHL